MAFQSLYRRYRSRTFGEVLGQQHVTTSLRNAVAEGRVAHAYLFSGPRGTGKTSTARILAKVLNCAAPSDGEPCGECDNCLAVEHGVLVDWLQELDAASNNRVEPMRELLERVPFGTSGNRKVIILDEVHMLSGGAANALLKTLEEPPDHVVFVLATTDPHKVLPTIQSRTQKFEFRLLPADVLAEHVRHVIDDADLGLGEDAVTEAVRRGGGSARDTLSALDQIAAAGGVFDVSVPVDDVIEGLVAQDVGAVLTGVAEAVGQGEDPKAIATAMIDRLRDAFLAAMRAPMRSTSEADRERATDLADRVPPARLTAALEALGTALVDMRQAPDARIPLEVALVRLSRPEADGSLDALLARVEELERRLASGADPEIGDPTAGSAAPAAASPVPETTSSPEPSPPEPESSPPTSSPVESSSPTAGRGGASAAREKLAARKEASQPPTAAPAPADRPAMGRARHATPAAAEPPAQPEAEPAAPPDAPIPPVPAAGSRPSRDEVVLAWGDEVLPNLAPPARAVFKAGRFLEERDGRYRFALPNQPHRDNCEKRRDAVETALSERFGQPIRLSLVVEPEDGASSHDGGGSESRRGGSRPDEDELIDPDQLVDAGEAPSGVERLTEAFPGAKLIDGET